MRPRSIQRATTANMVPDRKDQNTSDFYFKDSDSLDTSISNVTRLSSSFKFEKETSFSINKGTGMFTKSSDLILLPPDNSKLQAKVKLVSGSQFRSMIRGKNHLQF